MGHRLFVITSALLAAATAFASAAPSPSTATSLAPAPVAAETFDVGSLHVQRFGSGGAPLVLVPGLGSGTWTWYGTIAREAPTHTVYAIELPGFDGRPPAAETPLFAAFDRDLTALLTMRHIDRPVLVGHSLGGTLAIAYAEKHAAALRAVFAVDGLPVFPSLAMATPDQRASTAARVAAQVVSSDRAGFLAAAQLYASHVGVIDPALAAEIAPLMASSDPKAEAAWLTEDLDADLRPGLSSITIPFGEVMPYVAPAAGASPAYTLDQTKAFYTSLLAGAPDARVLPIEPSRHFAMLDQPETFYTTLDAFLGSLPALPAPSTTPQPSP